MGDLEAGVVDLNILLANMKATLFAQNYVFASVQEAHKQAIGNYDFLGSFVEDEGLSLIMEAEVADKAGLPYNGVFKRISLQVHSSLEAVGLTAAISNVLASKGISANVVAACYHDHIFVPSPRAEEAKSLLEKLSKDAQCEK
ncbi:ACT domain-containing protein [Polycladidibacter stylochi]|uniref:ACT domain-containing protein n=1 Tax=Polycladidibacter stylochi TaxID=1807766 RepID=UPI00082E5055|nr:ACT domain-containing protein [Pseudovibrio stylochi]